MPNMAPLGMKCGIGDHLLRGQGVLITNPRHISFVRKLYPSFRPQTMVCEECKEIMKRAYNIKYQRALQMQKHNQSLSSVSESKQSTTDAENSKTSDPSKEESGNNTSSADDSDQPTTSRKAASNRQRRDLEIGINVLRGLRNPDIQPAPRRRQFVNVNPDIMRIYSQNIYGG